ncbi:ParB/RepB/Spo0J family partition protein [Elusimicrobiota bacterium]
MLKPGLGENPLALIDQENTAAVKDRPAQDSGKEALSWISSGSSRGTSVMDIPVALIDPNPEQPRHHFDDSTLQELADSIKSKGLLQPIVVRQSNSERFTLIMGERRWRAAKIAGFKAIPALIRSEGNMLELALIENLQRENLSPIDTAEALHALKTQHGYTDEVLAKVVAKSRAWVTNTLSIIKLPDEAKQKAREANYNVRDVLIEASRQSDAEHGQQLIEKALAGEVNTTKLREERGKQGKTKARHFRFRYVPPDKDFSLVVVFNRKKVSKDEIKKALEMTLQSLTGEEG